MTVSIFSNIAFIPLSVIEQQTISIAPTTAKYFRLKIKNQPPSTGLGALSGGGAQTPKPPAGTAVAEFVLYPATRINHFEQKAGFAAATDLEKHATPATNRCNF